jgi:hypothetical protein
MKDRYALTGQAWGMLIAISALSASFIFTPATLPNIELCWFHRMTGLPCAGCGLTRSFCCLSHGKFAQAWAYNPFGYFAYASALALLVWPIIARRLPGLNNWILNYKLPRIFLIGIGALFILFGFYRIIRVIDRGWKALL